MKAFDFRCLPAADSLDKDRSDFIYSPGVSSLSQMVALTRNGGLFFLGAAVTHFLGRRSSVGRAVDS